MGYFTLNKDIQMNKYTVLLSTVLAVSLSMTFYTEAKTTEPNNDILKTLNGRYQNVVESCDGDTALTCSGVLLSVSKSWEKADTNDEVISTTYLRKDIGTTGLYKSPKAYGYILKDPKAAASAGTPITSYCGFSMDALTDIRKDSTLGPRCGTTLDDGTFYNSCREAGVNSTESYENYFQKIVGTNTSETVNLMHQCALDMHNIEDVNLFTKTHNTLIPKLSGMWNEILIKGWNWAPGDKLPFEAFFYQIVSNNQVTESNKLLSTQLRDDYESKTGLHIPVVGLDFTKFDAPFITAL